MQAFPNFDVIPVLQCECGVRLEEEENRNQGGSDGPGKDLTKGRMWEETEEEEEEELWEHTLIEALGGKTSLTR
jgi:hypothetical protein